MKMQSVCFGLAIDLPPPLQYTIVAAEQANGSEKASMYLEIITPVPSLTARKTNICFTGCKFNKL